MVQEIQSTTDRLDYSKDYNCSKDEIRVKLDAIKQEPKERVEKYFEKLDKLFQRGKIRDAEHRRRFLAQLGLEFKRLCVVKTYTNIKEMVIAAT
jgi:hypothetical protein